MHHEQLIHDVMSGARERERGIKRRGRDRGMDGVGEVDRVQGRDRKR